MNCSRYLSYDQEKAAADHKILEPNPDIAGIGVSQLLYEKAKTTVFNDQQGLDRFHRHCLDKLDHRAFPLYGYAMEIK